MLYTLENEFLRVRISDAGAELQSIVCRGAEYLWQGDTAYWSERAPFLFPICGRLTDGIFTYRGKRYAMGLHGFARHLPFVCEAASADALTLRLDANDTTRAAYPFDFSLTVTYTLDGSALHIACTVANRGGETMPFSIGAHPGFRVPLGDNTVFTDFAVSFPEACGDPRRFVITERGFLSREAPQPFAPLADGRRTLPLTHALFACDGIFLAQAGHTAVLSAPGCDRSVTLRFPDMPYLGIWQPANTDAPFVCLEPWAGMPAYDGEIDDLETKFAVCTLPPAAQKMFRLTISLT